MKKNKVWFQLTGTHDEGQPEFILHADRQFFIGGKHSLDDKDLKKANDDRNSRKPHDYNALNHTIQEIAPPPNKKGYPPYSWFYDNKMTGEDAFEAMKKIVAFDPNVYFVFFSCIPMLNVWKLANLIKDNYSERTFFIHYKRYFWTDEVLLDIARNWYHIPIEKNSAQDTISRDVETALINMSDSVYLADSIHTSGIEGVDSPEKIEELTCYRDAFLNSHKRIVLKSLKGEVYNLIDGIKV